MPKDFVYLKADTEQARKWLDSVKNGIGNMKPLFKGIEGDVRYFAASEFSDHNPNKWRRLTPNYKNWKTNMGYPETIGVRTGRLKAGASAHARVKISRKKMIYVLNEDNVKDNKNRKYAKWFDRKRPLFKWTALRVNSFIEGVTLRHINKQIGLRK